MKRIVLLALCLLLLVSCATKVSVADGASVSLLPPSAMPEMDSYQLLSGNIAGFGETACEAYLAVDASLMDMYLFAPTGQTIAHITYDGKDALMESTFIEYPIVAYYILADIQFCFAPFEVLGESLGAAGLGLSENITDEGTIRTITDRKGNVVYRISSFGSCVEVCNILRAYDYVIEFL